MNRLFALLALAPAVGACGRSPGDTSGMSKAVRPFPVEVAPVATRNLDYCIEAVGSLEPEEEVLVVARVPGVVERVAFQEGDVVTPETDLVTIDPARYALAADRARAAHGRAAADLREAEVSYTRRKALREKDPGWVSEEELSNYEARLDKTKAAVAEAKATLDLAEQDQREARVRAPRAGIINEKRVQTGQFVDRGAPLARLIDTRRLRLRFRVTESESVRLGAAPAVTFTTRSAPGRPVSAALYHVGRQADPATRMVDCLAWVDNPDAIEKPDAVLKPGFFAEVRVKVATREAAPVVPDAAILPTERGFVAFVVEGTTARERHPVLGLHTDDGLVEITEGLKAGEQLVVRGAHSLKDGATVEIAEKPQILPPKPR